MPRYSNSIVAIERIAFRSTKCYLCYFSFLFRIVIFAHRNKIKYQIDFILKVFIVSIRFNKSMLLSNWFLFQCWSIYFLSYTCSTFGCVDKTSIASEIIRPEMVLVCTKLNITNLFSSSPMSSMYGPEWIQNRLAQHWIKKEYGKSLWITVAYVCSFGHTIYNLAIGFEQIWFIMNNLHMAQSIKSIKIIRRPQCMEIIQHQPTISFIIYGSLSKIFGIVFLFLPMRSFNENVCVYYRMRSMKSSWRKATHIYYWK